MKDGVITLRESGSKKIVIHLSLLLVHLISMSDLKREIPSFNSLSTRVVKSSTKD